MQKRASKM